MRNEMMFIDPAIAPSDRLLFLGPFDSDDGPSSDIDPNWTLAHVMHAAGAFPSVKQAKNNGWDRPIPRGYDEFTVGKRKLRIYTLTRFD